MSSRFRSIVQYVIILGATVFLVWFSLRGLTVAGTGDTYEDKWSYLYSTWQLADKGWLFLMAGIAMASHLLRAERWRMLLQSTGNKVTLQQSFLSLLVGYIVNLVIPRGGEISRCYNLQQLTKTPVEVSLGTVVMERLLDVICLLIIIGLAFFFQTEKLFAFIASLPLGEGSNQSKVLSVLFVVAIVLIILLFVFWLVWRNERLKEKIKRIFHGFKEGLLSIRKLQRPRLFVFYSVFIWVLYFFMSYIVMLAFPSTSVLGLGAVLSIFALGSIAMAAPLPGGAGAYHTLVPAGIAFLYAVPASDAIAFVFVFHAWQTFVMIVAGALALITTSVLAKRP